MTKFELIKALINDPTPMDAKVAVYSDDNAYLPNVMVKSVYSEDYEILGNIVNIVI